MSDAAAPPGDGSGPDAWYWCPDHLLAAQRPLVCSVCGRPFEVAPAEGMPAGPYRPPRAAARRDRRERLLPLAGAASVGLVLAGVAAGVVALFLKGSPTTATDAGQGLALPAAPPPAVGAAGGAVDPGNSGASSIPLRSLDGRTLTLAGRWAATTRYGSGTAGVLGIFRLAGETPRLDVAVARDGSTLSVFQIPSVEPDRDVSALSAVPGGARRLQDGHVEAYSDAAALTVAGHQAVATRMVSTDAQGAVLEEVVYYVVAAGDHLDLIAVEGAGAAPADVTTAQRSIEAL